MKRKMVFACILLAVVVAFVSGCAVKYGKYNIPDKKTEQLFEHNDYLSLEVESPKFWKNKFAADFGIGGIINAANHGELDTTQGPISEYELHFYDIYSSLRYYPFNTDSKKRPKVNPYIGAGAGYFHLESTFRSKGKYVGSDFLFDYYKIREDDTLMAEGLNPHVEAGIAIILGERWGIVAEDRYEFGRRDGVIDMSGNIIQGGIKFEF